MNEMILKLVRHGTSLANTGAMNPQREGDHRVPLSPEGWEQARAAGAALGAEFVRQALIYTSPYLRTRETLQGIFQGAGLTAEQVAGLKVYEDPRLREVDHGYADVGPQRVLRETHGWFYYRYQGGESPADCYDRVSIFLESMMRQVLRKEAARVLIVSHGLAIRCFVMRFLHLTVEQFTRVDNPHNGDIVTIAPRGRLAEPVFRTDRWEVAGLRLLPEDAP